MGYFRQFQMQGNIGILFFFFLNRNNLNYSHKNPFKFRIMPSAKYSVFKSAGFCRHSLLTYSFPITVDIFYPPMPPYG